MPRCSALDDQLFPAGFCVDIADGAEVFGNVRLDGDVTVAFAGIEVMLGGTENNIGPDRGASKAGLRGARHRD